MFKSQEIADLQARISKLEGELKASTEGNATLQAELDKAKTALATAESQVTAQATTITDLQGKVTAAEQGQKAAEERATKAEASIDDQVTQRLAAAGVSPIAKDPQAKTADPAVQAEGPGLTGLAKARHALSQKQPKK